jgi:hypothetical protein
LNANNLYGWAMCEKLPVRNFEWRLSSADDRIILPVGSKTSGDKQSKFETNEMIKECSTKERGSIVEVDLEVI